MDLETPRVANLLRGKEGGVTGAIWQECSLPHVPSDAPNILHINRMRRGSRDATAALRKLM